jgi:hypothetical protein
MLLHVIKQLFKPCHLPACDWRSSFGGRAMPAQQILKGMAGMFESKDAKARALVKEVVVRILYFKLL